MRSYGVRLVPPMYRKFGSPSRVRVLGWCAALYHVCGGMQAAGHTPHTRRFEAAGPVVMPFGTYCIGRRRLRGTIAGVFSFELATRAAQKQIHTHAAKRRRGLP